MIKTRKKKKFTLQRLAIAPGLVVRDVKVEAAHVESDGLADGGEVRLLERDDDTEPAQDVAVRPCRIRERVVLAWRQLAKKAQIDMQIENRQKKKKKKKIVMKDQT